MLCRLCDLRRQIVFHDFNITEGHPELRQAEFIF
jgi:hypothetical protein